MNINEYAAAKQGILSRMVAALLHVFQQFMRGYMSARDWDAVMHTTYRVMKPYRDQATELARRFHDDNRLEQTGDQVRHDVFKDDYFPETWYRQTMRPVFQHAQENRSAEDLVEESVARVVKVVEDGARRTLIQAVQSDTSHVVRGFARFDPRPPTCAFCTMMISRGPVYVNPNTGGWPFDTRRLEKALLEESPERISEMMNKWHPDCTCVVVPVYKYDNYPTLDQEKEAFDIYDRARKAVAKDLKVGQSKINTRLILNKMRELIYSKNLEQDATNLGRNVA